jgi:RNA polymerase sigma-70 factor (ECF subfamily)
MTERPRHAPQLSHEEFARLVAAHQHRLHAYLTGMVGQTEQAFDLVQETFYEAWSAAERGIPPFQPGTGEVEVRRWLFRAASNNAISLLRRRRRIRWESLECIEEPSLNSLDSFEERVADREALRAALAELTPQDVACLLLRVVHGFNSAETGHILNTSPDNVNNRLARAKQRLRAAYAKQKPDRQEAQAPR